METIQNKEIDTISTHSNKYKEIIQQNAINTYGEVVDLHPKALNNIITALIESETKEIDPTKNKKKGFDVHKQITEFENQLIHSLGYFYFNYYKKIPTKLDRQYKFRFIYLCCYLKYDDDRLMIKGDNGRYKLILEGDLMELLNLSEREYYKTKSELIQYKLIHINDDKTISINNEVSLMGTIESKYKKNYTRVFKDGIKELYEKAKPKEHKKLGVFIDLLPHIHFRYNIICKNPTCELIEDIEPFTLKELSDLLNIYTSNPSKLKNCLLNIFVNDEKAMMLVQDFKKKFFIVNPRIYYKGNRLDEILYLEKIFRV